MRMPFETPVYVSDGKMLCGADHELICSMESITYEEVQYLVRCINAGAPLVRREEQEARYPK